MGKYQKNYFKGIYYQSGIYEVCNLKHFKLEILYKIILILPKQLFVLVLKILYILLIYNYNDNFINYETDLFILCSLFHI